MKTVGFSTRQLAALRLAGAPGSHQGWEKHAVTHGWEIRTHPGRGRGGMTREFIPPAPIAGLIARHQAGEKVGAEEVRLAMGKKSLAGSARGRRTGSARRPSIKRQAAADFTQSRFSAWLMGRLLNRRNQGAIDSALQLDRHELALRILMLVVERGGGRLADLVDNPEIADLALDLAFTARLHPGKG